MVLLLGSVRTDDDITELVADVAVPGLVAAGAVGGVRTIEIAHGWADIDRESAVCLDTMFSVASISKLYTALTIMRYVEDGRLRLDDEVASLLDTPHPALSGVTVHHLLSHTSGLPGLGARSHAYNQAGTASPTVGLCTWTDLLEYLSRLEVERLGEPGLWVNYLNEGYILLAGIVEVVGGAPFATAVAREVLAPAGLNRTAVGLTEARVLGQVSSEYHDGSPAPGWDAPAFYAAGGVYASAADLLKLGRLLLEPGVVATSETLTAMTSGHGDLHTPGRYYGYGIQLMPGWDGDTLLFHGGGRPGTRAHLLVAPRRDAVAVALANDTRTPVDTIATQVLGALLGHPVGDLPPGPEARPRRVVSPAQLRRVVGRYRSAEGLDLRFAVTDGELQMDRNGWVVDLVAVEPDAFVGADGKTVRFLGPPDRAPWGVSLDVRIATRRRLVHPAGDS